jgi:type II secretory pathway predicted ATPase ExeA
MIPPGRRLSRVLELIEQEKYFVLRAGRQTGKTTSAQWMVRHLRRSGRYEALWVDLQEAREQADPSLALPTIFRLLSLALANTTALPVPERAQQQEWLEDLATALSAYLRWLSHTSKKPLVLFLDEADGLVGRAMVSFLTQLRALYVGRSQYPAPHGIVLVGQRAVRDYILSEEERQTTAWLGTTSPFNITAETQTLEPFTAAEVKELYLKHTRATGQTWSKKAVALAYELGQGHPWLTNALAEICVERLVRDRTRRIQSQDIEEAKEVMIQERRTHIDSLIARLSEDRVRRILEPMLVGESLPFTGIDTDLQYVAGLGLIRLHQGQWRIANPIYREIVPRVQNFAAQTSLPHQTSWYVKPDGKLDLPKLMAAWQEFWREDGHLAAEGFRYKEAGPHLMLMAFFQRVLNGGGRLDREYALGKGVLDLLITWKGQRHLIEVKVRRDERSEKKAVEQVVRYLDGAGMKEGWVVLFDLRKEVSWKKKLLWREKKLDGKIVHVVGC